MNKERLVETLAYLNIESYIHLKYDIEFVADLIIKGQEPDEDVKVKERNNHISISRYCRCKRCVSKLFKKND